MASHSVWVSLQNPVKGFDPSAILKDHADDADDDDDDDDDDGNDDGDGDDDDDEPGAWPNLAR